jgi:hypothetical protein
MKFLLVISLVLNVWFATEISRLEAFRYSVQTFSCSKMEIVEENGKSKVKHIYDAEDMYDCLANTQPRASNLWNFIYGIGLL